MPYAVVVVHTGEITLVLCPILSSVSRDFCFIPTTDPTSLCRYSQNERNSGVSAVELANLDKQSTTTLHYKVITIFTPKCAILGGISSITVNS